MSAFSAVYDALDGDATLTGILTGGLYSGREVSDISRQATPAAYDPNSEILPCGLLKEETQTPFGPIEHSSRLFLALWLYAQTDLEALAEARDRAYAVLHRQTVGVAADQVWEVRHAGDVIGTEIVALNVPVIVSRFVVTANRG